MAKQRMARRPDGRGRPSGFGTTGYDMLASIINSAIDDRVGGMMPKVGTMRYEDGNRVRVDFDDGGSGAAGKTHGQIGGRKRQGDRVLMFPLGDGEWQAVGPIIDEGRPDRRTISGDDIDSDAIDARHIKENAIGRRHLPNKIIGQNQLDSNAVDQNNLISRFNSELGRDSRISGVDRRVDAVGSRIDSLQDKIRNMGGNN